MLMTFVVAAACAYRPVRATDHKPCHCLSTGASIVDLVVIWAWHCPRSILPSTDSQSWRCSKGVLQCGDVLVVAFAGSRDAGAL